MDVLMYQDEFLTELFVTKVLAVVPEFWTDLQRANAVCELQYPKNKLSSLAFVSLCRTKGDAPLAAELLIAGWSPHEAFISEVAIDGVVA